MKVTVFYSWQSDLPNSTNRGFIEKCIKDSLKQVFNEDKRITEWALESDSRDESGTPDIVSTLLSKIDKCDIFIADTSIINSESEYRKTSNPNVLFELGYASNKIGWEKIICTFNLYYGKVEDLPFDIRFRKPLLFKYSGKEEKPTKILRSQIKSSIKNIIDNQLSNKKFYSVLKREVDSVFQTMLFDFMKLFYFSDKGSLGKSYDQLFHISLDEIVEQVKDNVFLGFQLFKKQESPFLDFDKFINDRVNMHFFTDKEESILIKLIMLLRNFEDIHDHQNFYKQTNNDATKKYAVVDSHKMNPVNPPGSFLLLKKIDNEKGQVQDSGNFKDFNQDKLLKYFRINPEYAFSYAQYIHDIINSMNEWIRATGNFFVMNQRLFEDQMKNNKPPTGDYR